MKDDNTSIHHNLPPLPPSPTYLPTYLPYPTLPYLTGSFDSITYE